MELALAGKHPGGGHISDNRTVFAIHLTVIHSVLGVAMPSPGRACGDLVVAVFVKLLDVIRFFVNLLGIAVVGDHSVVPGRNNDVLGNSFTELIPTAKAFNVEPYPRTNALFTADGKEVESVFDLLFGRTANADLVVLVGDFLLKTEVEELGSVEYVDNLFNDVTAHLIILGRAYSVSPLAHPSVVTAGEVKLGKTGDSHFLQPLDFRAKLFLCPSALGGKLGVRVKLQTFADVDKQGVEALFGKEVDDLAPNLSVAEHLFLVAKVLFVYFSSPSSSFFSPHI